jgi:N-hydroxyarylamine O-acetyltransferase
MRALHRAHLLAIPYENLDVQFGRTLSIEREPIFEKIVARRRGGWCYEMNGLFGWALEQIGFRVVRGAGAVMREAMGDALIGNHLVLPVTLPEGQFLADVGFGDGPIDPVRLVPGDFSAHGFVYGLAQIDGGWWRLRNHPNGGAKSFDFKLEPADESLLAERCAFLQSSEISPFVQNLVCQRYDEAGLSILRGRTLRRLEADRIEERLISSADELVAVLARVFGLDIPEAASLWPKVVARHEALFGPDVATRSTG